MTHPFMIAGPCSAETPDQVLATARGIVSCREQHGEFDYIFRAGIWKPRSSPDTFQGVGEQGLEWMQRVQAEVGLMVAIEVTTADQTRMAMDAGMDYLWIGARTAANPIAVQAIADGIVECRMRNAECRIRGVLVKNPVNEDATLWIGNIERLEQTGLPVMAVHRGCNHRPCWQMAYTLKQKRPDIPLIMDPSHLSGKASAIADLCMKAQQLDYQGWMIETHISPQYALSDAQQQITPEELESIICSLLFEERQQLDCQLKADELAWLRSMIDEVDDELWDALSRRMDICHQMGLWKKTQGMPIVQPARYQEILQRRQIWGQERGIDAEAVRQIMSAIHKESVRIQS